jgi:uncharacterized membrane protein YkoI
MRRLTLLVFALLLAGVPARAESRCINDWSEAAPIVRQEGLYTVEKLTSEARSAIKGSIVKTTLCQDNGVWMYRLIVRVKGNLKMMTVDAKKPFPR